MLLQGSSRKENGFSKNLDTNQVYDWSPITDFHLIQLDKFDNTCMWMALEGFCLKMTVSCPYIKQTLLTLNS